MVDYWHGTREGSCACGAVKFTTKGVLRPVVACHCTQCRKQTGHYYAATSVEETNITISGKDHLTWYSSSLEAQRGFCKICGSAMFWKPASKTRLSILAGCFDGESALTMGWHIFVDDKGSYYDIRDGLPQFPEATPLEAKLSMEIPK